MLNKMYIITKAIGQKTTDSVNSNGPFIQSVKNLLERMLFQRAWFVLILLNIKTLYVTAIMCVLYSYEVYIHAKACAKVSANCMFQCLSLMNRCCIMPPDISCCSTMTHLSLCDYKQGGHGHYLRSRVERG